MGLRRSSTSSSTTLLSSSAELGVWNVRGVGVLRATGVFRFVTFAFFAATFLVLLLVLPLPLPLWAFAASCCPSLSLSLPLPLPLSLSLSVSPTSGVDICTAFFALAFCRPPFLVPPRPREALPTPFPFPFPLRCFGEAVWAGLSSSEDSCGVSGCSFCSNPAGVPKPPPPPNESSITLSVVLAVPGVSVVAWDPKLSRARGEAVRGVGLRRPRVVSRGVFCALAFAFAFDLRACR